MFVEKKVGESLRYESRTIYIRENFIDELNQFVWHNDLNPTFFTTKSKAGREIFKVVVIGKSCGIHVYVYTHELTYCQ